MPIPLLLGLGAIAAGSLVNYAGKEVVKDYENELNSINSEMEKMTKEINEKVNNSKNELLNIIEKLNNQRENVYSYTLKNYAQTWENIDFEELGIPNEKLAKVKNTMVSFSNNSYHSSKILDFASSTVLASVLFGALTITASMSGVFVVSLTKGIKLGMAINEAKAERSKLKVECEKALVECAKVNNITAIGKDSSLVIAEMQIMADRALQNVKDIISKSKARGNKYTQEETEKLMTITNLICGLNDLVDMELVDKSGNVNPRYENILKNTKQISRR